MPQLRLSLVFPSFVVPVKSTVDRLTSFRAQLSRANKTFAVSRNNDVSRTGETYEFIYFLKKLHESRLNNLISSFITL